MHKKNCFYKYENDFRVLLVTRRSKEYQWKNRIYSSLTGGRRQRYRTGPMTGNAQNAAAGRGDLKFLLTMSSEIGSHICSSCLN